jgi:hypothetical protein
MVVAALGQEVRVDGPPHLDGVSTPALVKAVQVALEHGLVDDLDWIAPSAAAVALYELSAALPPGRERREIGRRVFSRLYEGNASTFAAVATRMALGSSGRPFEAATLRARIGLVFSLPVASSVNADPLALVLVTRRELFERWLVKAATGPLPARRLAARLLERAAREAVNRANEGDAHPLDVLVGQNVRPVLDRLLADREPLVWHHAAAARGILAAIASSLREDIDLALDPALTPTEWRRAAVSLAAMGASDLTTSVAECRRLLDGDLIPRDPGLLATLVWGARPLIESEPEAAADLLDQLCSSGRLDVLEAVSALLVDVAHPEFVARTAERVLAATSAAVGTADSALVTVIHDTVSGLGANGRAGGVHAAVRRALEAYENDGARSAHEFALEALARAQATMDALEVLGRSADPTALLAPLVDLDQSAIEQSRLHDLLLLGRSPGDASTAVPEMERLYDRLGTFILDREETPGADVTLPGGTLVRQKMLRTLLHLGDLDPPGRTDGESEVGRTRLRRTLRVLLARLTSGTDVSVRRLLCAALARSLDAVARDGIADPGDLLLVVVDAIDDVNAVSAMAEASTHPDVREVLGAYAEFLSRAVKDPRLPSLFDMSRDEAEIGFSRRDEAGDALAFVELSRGIGTNGSHRGEALRQVVRRLGRALDAVVMARGLSDLVESPDGEGSSLGDIEQHVGSFRRLLTGARRRVLDDEGDLAIDVVAEVPRLSSLIERAVADTQPTRTEFALSIGELVADLPQVVGATLSRILARVATLPVAPPSDVTVIPLENRRVELPDWLMPRRTIGSFYVVRALGSGGVSSVFVARRVEERRAHSAELYALKVPTYDPSTARSLSETEFMQLFREEAGALLSLPQHDNLSRFVTFDLAARPKPILVMELIQGAALDRLIRSRSISTAQAIHYLDGILAGLEAMHGVGVGHLDVKPSNVILRHGKTPVLVDFGLSGRNIRPGCGTLEYCAPEVLGGGVPHVATPAAADMYSFACTAFELLTGRLLFDADDEQLLMNLHLSHDGWPERLRHLASIDEYANLSVVLAACLRPDPDDRPTATEVRSELVTASEWVGNPPWPLRMTEAVTELTA